jgi:hypothetical protein
MLVNKNSNFCAIHFFLAPFRIAQIGGWNWLQVSILPIFYEQHFHMKVFCAAFMCLQFGFAIFWQKDFGAKAAHKLAVEIDSSLPGSLRSNVDNNIMEVLWPML